MTEPSLIRTRFLTALMFIAILLVMFVKIKTPYNFYDEGFAVFDATRVLHGEAPYKDFWGIYPPGQFYAIAAVFGVLGDNLLNARLYDTFVRFLLTVGAYLVARRLSSRGPAALAAVVIGFWLASAGFYSYAMFPALALGIWAMWAWLKYAETRRRAWLLPAGGLLGLASLVRWDMGSYAAAGMFAAGYLYLLACPDASTPPASRLGGRRYPVRAWLAPLATLAWAILPALLVAGLGYGLVGLRSGWENLYAQVFAFPTFTLRSVRWLAYPALLPADFPPSYDWWRFYLVIAILAPAGLYFAYRAARELFAERPGALDWRFYGTLGLIVFGGLLFNQALSRYDMIHVLPASVVTYLVCAALFSWAVVRASSARVKAAIYLLMAVPTLVYFRPAYQELVNTMDAYPPWGCYSSLERLGCAAVDPNQQGAAKYIQASARPGDLLYVGNTRHDKIFVNDAGFYYLAGLPSATRYNELHPGVANTLPVQQEIAGELEAKKTRWVVLAEIWESREPNASARSTGVTYLDAYIREKYRPVMELGWYRIMERRGD